MINNSVVNHSGLRRTLHTISNMEIPLSLLAVPRLQVMPVKTRKDKDDAKNDTTGARAKSIPEALQRTVPASLTAHTPPLHASFDNVTIDAQLDPGVVARRRLPSAHEASFIGSPHALSDAFSGPRVAPERRAPRDDLDVDGTRQIIYGDKLLRSEPDPSYEPMRGAGGSEERAQVEVGMQLVPPDGVRGEAARVHAHGEGEKLKKELSIIGHVSDVEPHVERVGDLEDYYARKERQWRAAALDVDRPVVQGHAMGRDEGARVAGEEEEEEPDLSMADVQATTLRRALAAAPIPAPLRAEAVLQEASKQPPADAAVPVDERGKSWHRAASTPNEAHEGAGSNMNASGERLARDQPATHKLQGAQRRDKAAAEAADRQLSMPSLARQHSVTEVGEEAGTGVGRNVFEAKTARGAGPVAAHAHDEAEEFRGEHTPSGSTTSYSERSTVTTRDIPSRPATRQPAPLDGHTGVTDTMPRPSCGELHTDEDTCARDEGMQEGTGKPSATGTAAPAQSTSSQSAARGHQTPQEQAKSGPAQGREHKPATDTRSIATLPKRVRSPAGARESKRPEHQQQHQHQDAGDAKPKAADDAGGSHGGWWQLLARVGEFLHTPRSPQHEAAHAATPQPASKTNKQAFIFHDQDAAVAAAKGAKTDKLTPEVDPLMHDAPVPVFRPGHGMWASTHTHGPLPPGELFSSSPRSPLPVEDAQSLLLPAILPEAFVEPKFGLQPLHEGEHTGRPSPRQGIATRGLLAHELGDSARALSEEMGAARRVLAVLGNGDAGHGTDTGTDTNASAGANGVGGIQLTRGQRPGDSARATLLQLVLGESESDVLRARPHAPTCPAGSAAATRARSPTHSPILSPHPASPAASAQTLPPLPIALAQLSLAVPSPPISSPGAPAPVASGPASLPSMHHPRTSHTSPFAFRPSTGTHAPTASRRTLSEAIPVATPVSDSPIDVAASVPAEQLHPPSADTLTDSETILDHNTSPATRARSARGHDSFASMRAALYALPSPTEDASPLDMVQPAAQLLRVRRTPRLRARSPPPLPSTLRDASGEDSALPMPLSADSGSTGTGNAGVEPPSVPRTPTNTPADAMGGNTPLPAMPTPIRRDPLVAAGLADPLAGVHHDTHAHPHAQAHGQADRRHALLGEDRIREAPLPTHAHAPARGHLAPITSGTVPAAAATTTTSTTITPTTTTTTAATAAIVTPLYRAPPPPQPYAGPLSPDECATHQHPHITTHPELIAQPPVMHSPRSVWQLPQAARPPLTRSPEVDMHRHTHPTAALARVRPSLRAPVQDPRRDPAGFLEAVQWRAAHLRRFDRRKGTYDDAGPDAPTTFNAPTAATAALPPCAGRLGALGYTGPCLGLPRTRIRRATLVGSGGVATEPEGTEVVNKCDRGLCCVLRGVRGGWLCREEQARRLRGEEEGVVAWRRAPPQELAKDAVVVRVAHMGGRPSGQLVRERLRAMRHGKHPGFNNRVRAPIARSLAQRVWGALAGHPLVRRGKRDTAVRDWRGQAAAPVLVEQSPVAEDSPPSRITVSPTVPSTSASATSTASTTAATTATKDAVADVVPGAPATALAAALAAGPITRVWKDSPASPAGARPATHDETQKAQEGERHDAASTLADRRVSDGTGGAARDAMAVALAHPLLHTAIPDTTADTHSHSDASSDESCPYPSRRHRGIHRREQETGVNRGQRRWSNVRIPDGDMDRAVGHIHPGAPDVPIPASESATARITGEKATESEEPGVLDRVRALWQGDWQWEVDERSIVGHAEAWAGEGRWGIGPGHGCVAVLKPGTDAATTVATKMATQQYALPYGHPPVPTLNSFGMQRADADYRHDYALNCLLLATRRGLRRVRAMPKEKKAVAGWRYWSAPVWDSSKRAHMSRREHEFKEWYRTVTGMATPHRTEAEENTIGHVAGVVKEAVKDAVKDVTGLGRDDAKDDRTRRQTRRDAERETVAERVQLHKAVAHVAATEDRVAQKEEALRAELARTRMAAAALLRRARSNTDMDMSGISAGDMHTLREAQQREEDNPDPRAMQAVDAERAKRVCAPGLLYSRSVDSSTRHETTDCPSADAERVTHEMVDRLMAWHAQHRRSCQERAAREVLLQVQTTGEQSPGPRTEDLQAANLAAIQQDIRKARHALAAHNNAQGAMSDTSADLPSSNTGTSPPVGVLALQHTSPAATSSPVAVRLTPQPLPQPLASPLPAPPFVMSTSPPQQDMLRAAPPLVAQGPAPDTRNTMPDTRNAMPATNTHTSAQTTTYTPTPARARYRLPPAQRLLYLFGHHSGQATPLPTSPVFRTPFGTEDRGTGRATAHTWLFGDPTRNTASDATCDHTYGPSGTGSVYLAPLRHLQHCPATHNCADHVAAAERELAQLAGDIAQQHVQCSGHNDHCAYADQHRAARPLQSVGTEPATDHLTAARDVLYGLRAQPLPPLVPEMMPLTSHDRAAPPTQEPSEGSAEVSCAPPPEGPVPPRSLSVQSQCGHGPGRHHPRPTRQPLPVLALSADAPAVIRHADGLPVTPASDVVLAEAEVRTRPQVHTVLRSESTATAGDVSSLSPSTSGLSIALAVHGDSPPTLGSPSMSSISHRAPRTRLQQSRSQHQEMPRPAARLRCHEGEQEVENELSPDEVVHVKTLPHDEEEEVHNAAGRRRCIE